MRLIRNQVYPQGYRGFESLSLRRLLPFSRLQDPIVVWLRLDEHPRGPQDA